MAESKEKLKAGWARSEIAPPTRYPMAGYLARKGTSQGSFTPLYIRALVLQQGNLRVCIVVADLLLISSSWAVQLRKRVSKATAIPASNIIVAATHTHSGPLVDTTPFQLSNRPVSKRVRQFMHLLENNFVQTAIAALKNLQTVEVSYSRSPIRNLATDRNDPRKNLTQPFVLVHFDAADSRAVLGVLPCHPTVLGAANLYYSGDLHGEIARRFECQVDVALIANGATANISTRFTRRSQTRAQVSRFATLVMSQIKSRPLRPCAPCKVAIAIQSVRLSVRDFRRQHIKDSQRTGRLVDVANEGARVAMQLSKTREFRRKNMLVDVTLMRLGPFFFAALPFELYAETSRFLWSRARAVPLCYANGYWGYVFAPGAGEADYEVISSPFTSNADKLLREAILSLASKHQSSGGSK